MFGSLLVYSGLILALTGLLLACSPARRRLQMTRRPGLALAAIGFTVAGVALVAPAGESRADQAASRLDEFAPAWQFREFHTLRIAASPVRVFDAIRQVRADEIALFHTLTWIRRGGQPLPESILNAGSRESLIDVATRTGFVRLADEAPRELVIGTVVLAPERTRGKTTLQTFRTPPGPGFALAAMNFVVAADGPTASLVSTETRVFATSPEARRQFAAYWRVIYPGSAIIRRMWLRAIERRATSDRRS
jgi:hypothetical protein